MLLPNVQNVIARHAIAASLARPGATQTSMGFVNHGTVVTTSIRAVVQPAQPKLLERLPEGQRAGAWYTVWRVAGDLQLNDRITYSGKAYQIEHLLDWVEAGNFASALAKQVTPDGV